MKNKPQFAVPLSAFLAFCILFGSGAFFQRHPIVHVQISILICEFLAFAPAGALLMAFCPVSEDKKIFRVSNRKKPIECIAFVIFSSLAVSFFSFLINCIIYFIFGEQDINLSSSILTGTGSSYMQTGTWLICLLLPAAIEELFFRGAVQRALFPKMQMKQLILVSGLLFALLHGSLMDLIGPFVAGMYYCWLVYALGSVWFAVLAHCIHSIVFYFIAWLLEAFSTFGIWSKFPMISLILFLLFLYFALRLAEDLLLHRRIHFDAPAAPDPNFLRKLFGNAAMVALLFAYIAKGVLGII